MSKFDELIFLTTSKFKNVGTRKVIEFAGDALGLLRLFIPAEKFAEHHGRFVTLLSTIFPAPI